MSAMSASSPFRIARAIVTARVGVRRTAMAEGSCTIGRDARGSLIATSRARDDQIGARQAGVVGVAAAELLEGDVAAPLQALAENVDRSCLLGGVLPLEVRTR